MIVQPGKGERVVSALGVLSAAGLAALLLVTWGHHITYFDNPGGSIPPTEVNAYRGTSLPGSLVIPLVALAGAVTVIGSVAIVRSVPTTLLLLCFLAMVAEILIVVRVWSNNDTFAVLSSNPGQWHDTWHWAAGTIAAALMLAASGTASWLGLLAARLAGKPCPDCAERLRRNVVECPHCGFPFPLSSRLKRCEACGRTVKAAAHICRYCRHRFSDERAIPEHQRSEAHDVAPGI